MAMRDMTVVGAGIFGLSVAWACQRRGARVRVVDRRGVAAGASGGIVGALAPHTPENWNEKKAFQFESLLSAEAFWTEVEQVSGCSSGYRRSGRLQPVPDAAALDRARDRQASADALWQGAARWRVCKTSDFPHWAPPSATGYLIHDTLSALIHPRRATLALARAFVARGGVIEVTEAAPPAGIQVWATGYQGLAALSKGAPRAVGAGVKGQALLLRHDAAGLPQIFADTLHFVPHDDGTLAIGSTSERFFDAPDRVDAQLDALHDRAMAAMPALARAPVVDRWAGVRPRARSRAPMLGRHPTLPDVFIANGGFKIGFGMAPKVGEVMAGLILEGRDEIPERFAVKANL
ncbi:NAD(P)/FAD-dependent oxidoreductase [Brevirhabdus sp.]|uniref:NAD(P)/FAD-dependent oxidoreductase n=1 Tax=Brevirhabdus sp. TaxID=2004514 RepID=UPI004058CDCF